MSNVPGIKKLLATDVSDLSFTHSVIYWINSPGYVLCCCWRFTHSVVCWINSREHVFCYDLRFTHSVICWINSRGHVLCCDLRFTHSVICWLNSQGHVLCWSQCDLHWNVRNTGWKTTTLVQKRDGRLWGRYFAAVPQHQTGSPDDRLSSTELIPSFAD